MGNQEHNGKQKRKKFYNEREWRYIPGGSKVLHAFGLKEKRQVESEFLEPTKMQIDLNEIEYIIVKKVEDIEPLLATLKQITEKSTTSYEYLISKILTSWQINRDF